LVKRKNSPIIREFEIGTKLSMTSDPVSGFRTQKKEISLGNQDIFFDAHTLA